MAFDGENVNIRFLFLFQLVVLVVFFWLPWLSNRDAMGIKA